MNNITDVEPIQSPLQFKTFKRKYRWDFGPPIAPDGFKWNENTKKMVLTEEFAFAIKIWKVNNPIELSEDIYFIERFLAG